MPGSGAVIGVWQGVQGCRRVLLPQLPTAAQALIPPQPPSQPPARPWQVPHAWAVLPSQQPRPLIPPFRVPSMGAQRVRCAFPRGPIGGWCLVLSSPP